MSVAGRLRARIAAAASAAAAAELSSEASAARVNSWLARFESREKIPLTEEQRDFVRSIAHAPVTILTGGPGCGKTYTTYVAVCLWRAMKKNARVQICAPTGRAAQRLAEMFGGGGAKGDSAAAGGDWTIAPATSGAALSGGKKKQASLAPCTIHRLLEFRQASSRLDASTSAAADKDGEAGGEGAEAGGAGPAHPAAPRKPHWPPPGAAMAGLTYDVGEGGPTGAPAGGRAWFGRHEENPLQLDALVIDEASMLDLPLAAALLAALPLKAQLLIVGDADQLPPVGPGSFLKDALASGVVPTRRLTEVFRQAQASSWVQGMRSRGAAGPLGVTEGSQEANRVVLCASRPQESKIVNSAHDVNRGVFPTMPIYELPEQLLSADGGGADSASVVIPPPAADCVWIEIPSAKDSSDGGAAVAAAVAAVAGRVLPALGFDARRDLQVITPMHGGAAGTRALNAALSRILNPAAAPSTSLADDKGAKFGYPGQAGIARGGNFFRVGDRVIQTARGAILSGLQVVVRRAQRAELTSSPPPLPSPRPPHPTQVNDYNRGVLNGDLGYVREVVPDQPSLTVSFPVAGIFAGHGDDDDDGSEPPLVRYSGSELDALAPAWAITCHKAQGSEYPVVVLALSSSQWPLLSRRLLYTAVTRAKRQLFVVAPKNTLAAAVSRATDDKRYSHLLHRLSAPPLPSAAAVDTLAKPASGPSQPPTAAAAEPPSAGAPGPSNRRGRQVAPKKQM